MPGHGGGLHLVVGLRRTAFAPDPAKQGLQPRQALGPGEGLYVPGQRQVLGLAAGAGLVGRADPADQQGRRQAEERPIVAKAKLQEQV
ncbi:hypothetical protein [Phenylobacterium sp.]|uniref:hypothetical protein n=1 Tax=Phenylobacterium sp. TaxID=1871053 RepID=UPI00391C66FD